MPARKGITIALLGPDALIRGALAEALRNQGFRRIGWATMCANPFPVGKFVCNVSYAQHHSLKLLEAGCVVVWCGSSPPKPAGDQAAAGNNFALMGHIHAQVFSVNQAICEQFVEAAVGNELTNHPGEAQHWFGALATESLTYTHPRKGD